MLEKVKNTIKVNNLIGPEDKVLVALSGGCDSVCLCLALEELGIEFAAAHLNHSIRDEADSDEEFVKSFSQKHGFRLFTKKADIPSVAAMSKVSLESAGRNERYKFFEEICAQYGYTKVAVAHNKNDNAETFIMNLMRGSGLKGLCSIPVKRGNIIRPLIEISRSEIEHFVSQKEECFVTDITNFSNDYTRNKIRNEIIPALLQINENFIESVFKTTELLKADYNFIHSVAEGLVSYKSKNAILNKEELLKYPDAVISLALMKAYEYVAGTSKDFEKKHIDYIVKNLNKVSHGNIIDLCFDVRCSIRYGKVIFEKQPSSKDFEYTLKCGQSVYVKETGITFTMTKADKAEFSENCQCFSLDGDEVKIRNRKNGDTIIPFGSQTEKKLKKIFIDKKVDVTMRDKIPVIEYKDDIIWVMGVCRSCHYKIDDSAEDIYIIRGEKNYNEN